MLIHQSFEQIKVMQDLWGRGKTVYSTIDDAGSQGFHIPDVFLLLDIFPAHPVSSLSLRDSLSAAFGLLFLVHRQWAPDACVRMAPLPLTWPSFGSAGVSGFCKRHLQPYKCSSVSLDRGSSGVSFPRSTSGAGQRPHQLREEKSENSKTSACLGARSCRWFHCVPP